MSKVLVVDDDPTSRDVLAQMIGFCGQYNVDTARDGIEALNKLSFDQYDVIFTDIKMPRMDGIEFLRRAKEVDPSVPVVVVTALHHIEPAVESMRLGASDFLTKPLRVADVKNVLERILSEKALIDSIKARTDGKESLLKLINTELFKKLNIINMLFKYSTTIEKMTDSVSIIKALPEYLIKVIPVRRAGFFGLVDDMLVLEVGQGFEHSQKVYYKGTLLEQIIKNRTPYHVFDPNEVDPFTGIPLQGGMVILSLMVYDTIFGYLVLAEKKDGTCFYDDEVALLNEFMGRISMKLENLMLFDITNQHLVNILKTLVLTIEARDSYTKRHSERVTEIALEIAEEMNSPQAVKDALAFGGFLHDIGKIGVKDTILLKPGRLTKEEFEEIKKHPVIGASIVEPLGSYPEEMLIIRHHHERFDGQGYPDGLRGEEIPITARILAVADTYDSMTSTRPYRKGLPHQVAIDEIKRCSGTQFDPEVVKAFLNTPTAKMGKNWKGE